jgi:hypothetical protein
METSNNARMHELLTKISGNTGISTDKASEILQTVSNFIKEKYPLLAGTVDSVLEINDHTDNNEIN